MSDDHVHDSRVIPAGDPVMLEVANKRIGQLQKELEMSKEEGLYQARGMLVFGIIAIALFMIAGAGLIMFTERGDKLEANQKKLKENESEISELKETTRYQGGSAWYWHEEYLRVGEKASNNASTDASAEAVSKIPGVQRMSGAEAMRFLLGDDEINQRMDVVLRDPNEVGPLLKELSRYGLVIIPPEVTKNAEDRFYFSTNKGDWVLLLLKDYKVICLEGCSGAKEINTETKKKMGAVAWSAITKADQPEEVIKQPEANVESYRDQVKKLEAEKAELQEKIIAEVLSSVEKYHGSLAAMEADNAKLKALYTKKAELQKKIDEISATIAAEKERLALSEAEKLAKQKKMAEELVRSWCGVPVIQSTQMTTEHTTPADEKNESSNGPITLLFIIMGLSVVLFYLPNQGSR